ncbi:ATP-binding protein [Parachlamydia acanthamoebae]|uniref:ATP-binding protein n=1 Tax=Parachlamydia acanthamoebae TaxID=83552 RepID=UPI0001C17968|nr:DUF87 domain-containing protein [Parachlamydia acanthamoebae]EFB40648.1 hypothetical protein pah_c197o023 [Parachlamydia acanthamoebae str. Hall's coccus]
MQEIDKLGVFYLGKLINPSNGKETDHPLLYDSKDLTTHAVCVGMTGSGKTGLGIVLLEEAALDGIPAIIIDPKGDLGNLLLAFPDLKPEDFLPWIDADEASRNGETKEAYAAKVAKDWKEGLAEWGEDAKRIARYKNSVETTIYTPASQAGLPISLLNSFGAPPPELVLDTSAFRDRILSTTSSLLGLLGIDADPIKSKEHILISTIFEKAWKENRDLDLATLIQEIQKPPFDKVGVFDLETFYPAKERLNLSISLNNLLASPGFQAWMEGEPLDIQRLLYTKDGKPRHSILSIGHLSESERMFFVTLLLNETLAWIRRQSGTSSLRAILCMDEIYGYFPPTANPPSKTPMLTLLKQARAFGLGVVLTTQNPVDLDYKGLSNCGTWFIGKLQTDRDRSRIEEGLKMASLEDSDPNEMHKLLSMCGKRTFVMKDVHLKASVLFQTRWTLSYLRGPLTLPQIQSLTTQVERKQEELAVTAQQPFAGVSRSQKPLVPPGVQEYTSKKATDSPEQTYRPLVLAIGKAHFIDSKNDVDTWQDYVYVAGMADTGNEVQWSEGSNLPGGKESLTQDLPKKGMFEELPADLMQAKNYPGYQKSFLNFLYQSQTLDLFKSSDLKSISKIGESEGDFRARLAQLLREKRDADVEKLRKAYADKIQTLQDRMRRAQEKLTKQQQQAGQQKFDTLISLGRTLLGAFLGKKIFSSTRISEAGSTLKKAGKIGKESQDVASAEESVKDYQQQLDELESSLQKEILLIQSKNVDEIPLDKVSIRPRKTDLVVETVAILWWPLPS